MMAGSMIALWAVAIGACVFGLTGMSLSIWQSAKPSSSYAEVSARSATFTDAFVSGNLTGPTITSIQHDVQTCTCSSGAAASSSGAGVSTVIQSGTCVVALRVYNTSINVYIASATTTYQVIDTTTSNPAYKHRCINVTALPGTILSTGRTSALDVMIPTINQFSPLITALKTQIDEPFFLGRSAFTLSPNFTTSRLFTLDYGTYVYATNSIIQATGPFFNFGTGTLSTGNILIQAVFNGATICSSYILPA
jgi:hypothetical protein